WVRRPHLIGAQHVPSTVDTRGDGQSEADPDHRDRGPQERPPAPAIVGDPGVRFRVTEADRVETAHRAHGGIRRAAHRASVPSVTATAPDRARAESAAWRIWPQEARLAP